MTQGYCPTHGSFAGGICPGCGSHARLVERPPLPKREIRYICIGGPVGPGTHVAASRLPQLYGVDKASCICADGDDDYRLRGLDLSAFTILRPRADGRYKVPA